MRAQLLDPEFANDTVHFIELQVRFAPGRDIAVFSHACCTLARLCCFASQHPECANDTVHLTELQVRFAPGKDIAIFLPFRHLH